MVWTLNRWRHVESCPLLAHLEPNGPPIRILHDTLQLTVIAAYEHWPADEVMNGEFSSAAGGVGVAGAGVTCGQDTGESMKLS